MCHPFAGAAETGSRRSIKCAIEAAVTIGLVQFIGNVRICCAKGFGFESSFVQLFCNFFLFAVVINIFL